MAAGLLSGSLLVVRPENGSVWDLFKFLVFADYLSGGKFLEGSDVEAIEDELRGGGDKRWVIAVSIAFRKLLGLLRTPMRLTGLAVEFLLNFLYLNGYLSGLIWKIITGNFGKVKIPTDRDAEDFLSIVGLLDPRINLYSGKPLHDSVSGDIGMHIKLGDKVLIDLCMMSAKLAYENPNVIKNVVNNNWKMHFVEYLDCWNVYQNRKNTQVFVLCDKPKDANLILISFRGTKCFDADGWITDFDYTSYKIPEVGKIHVGFLEALGLGHRASIVTLYNNLTLKAKKKTIKPASFQIVPPHMADETAYNLLNKALKRLLSEHKNAKFVVTGHSLGGALAMLFPTVLVLQEENELLERFLGVYTFGQPRIGNEALGKYMDAHVQNLEKKYFRVVYCNDIVPRLPYDDKYFSYKHFGTCLYYDGLYMEQELKEEPNPNFFDPSFLIGKYINAVWELIRSIFMGYLYGSEYKEGWFCLAQRVIGLALPGTSDHCTTNYVNSVRLGRLRRG